MVNLYREAILDPANHTNLLVCLATKVHSGLACNILALQVLSVVPGIEVRTRKSGIQEQHNRT